MVSYAAAYISGNGNQPAGYVLRKVFGPEAYNFKYAGFLKAPKSARGMQKTPPSSLEKARIEEQNQGARDVLHQALKEWKENGKISPETMEQYEQLSF